ncbi:hypothetical protein QBC34DRAFT_407083 [Podospora aff. communis PSN243]|uniref:DUF4045 domain-containing protein n=1 Tax=Podospora aff. communis PSN243 TaxID=3040156 RepID=A0AAV9GPN4_9PEZI|nr:hypothetical protein QBC34DRAFT_407083 [Podospora aff. communis PSN243]
MSDEVSDFLRSVELLKGRREEEDEARSRELEEKILQEKRERQARRAERARSISPQKSSPANTPSPTSHRIGLASASDGAGLFPPSPEASGSPRSRPGPSSETMDSAADYSDSPTKENDSPFDSDPKRSSLSLSPPAAGGPPPRSPLSWQRRPPSRGADRPKSRPLSTVAVENAAARSSPNLAEQAPAADQPLTRDQIAQSLSGRDPAWFRQTADRGQSSAAYRRNQVEDPDTLDMSSLRTQLPGMSRETAKEPSGVTQESRAPASPSKLGTPLSLTGAQRLEPPAKLSVGDVETPSAGRQSVDAHPGRTSPTRAPSPTKGMGGFVQSAMMKRSDSVKRWSVTSPGGLQRADSVVSNRNSLERSTTTKSRPGSILRDGSATPSSRPTSSHEKEEEKPAEPKEEKKVEPKEEKPSEPQESEKTTPPTSPSKTMDPRRWSPTKSSWLEAALNKPESPKPKPAPPPVSQPAWMVELNKVKAQKTGTQDRNPSVPKKPEVKPSGLLRSTPMGATVKPVGLGVFPGVPVTAASDKPVPGGFRSTLNKAPSRRGSEDPGNESQGASDDAAKNKVERDFRANLKPRAPLPDTGSSGQPDELKNVFGNLRRTKTQNYVAPDELKSNILRGKAALNATGGPKNRERVDEFKEAILKKKEDFKKAQLEGRSVARTTSNSSSERTLPEGLAKKLELHRTGSRPDSTAVESPLHTPSTFTESARSSYLSTRTRDSDLPARASTEVEKEPAPKLEVKVPQKEASAPGRLQSKVGGGGLADRFNPALAGLLARGPPASGPPKGTGASGAPGAADGEETASPGPQLIHMTKNRARGPKRKAPTSAAAPAKEPEKPAVEAELPAPSKQTSPPKPAKPFHATRPEVISLVDSRRTFVQDKPQTVGSVIPLVDSSKRIPDEVPMTPGRPITIVDSPTVKTRPRSPTKVHEQVAALAALSQQQSSKPAGDEAASQPSSPRKLDLKRRSQFLDQQSQAIPKPDPVKSRPSSPTKERPASPEKERPKTPGRERFGGLADPFGKPLGNENPEPKPIVPTKSGSAGFGGASFASRATEAQSQLESKPQLPPKGARPLPAPPSPTRTPIASPARSPTKYGQEVTAILSDFFGSDRPRRNYTADTADILSRRPRGFAKVQTQRAQLFQFSGEGKKVPVPAHNERVLFEREMYLCPHSFLNNAGKKVNEVYFWVGDEVPQTVAEDAQLFAQREARALGGQLITLVQGKETSEFLQALGGIVIVRRGSSNKYDSLASNMLCGRRYLGQIAFDEVDFSPSSLCSGFPYLITQQGKCYLWKGKGSDVEELGCARLVGMDLALMGELLEVEEGKEPANFWEIFDGGSRAQSADHWRLKPNYERYCGRLFRSDAADRQQIIELSPFKQTDLLSTNIYVLDAFFELYIIVGSRSQNQYAAFHNALDFAQEYAILAAGMEDRPFVPISTVVLEGIPRDLKSVFRKWHDAASPTLMNAPPPEVKVAPPQPLKRGRSLRIVPLGQALQALSD